MLFALALILVITTGIVGSSNPAFASDDENIALLDRSSKAFASVVKKAGPAVVNVRVEKTVKGGSYHGNNPLEFFNDPFFEKFFGPQFRQPQRQKPREFKQEGTGSGFIISKDGYILTNNHVVGDADVITVRLADEREFKAKVIGTDPQSDVALIKIEDGGDLPTIPLGNSDKLEVGEWVIAIGSPFQLSQTVTVGVVSAKGRSRIGINDYEDFIQTDAAINPGNSGGPLLNIYGEVIGINTAIFSRSGGYMGIGFAIPIDMATAIKEQLLKHGKVTRGWLGVAIQDVDEKLAESFKLESTKGVIISEVTEDSPADKAGLKDGDVLIALNGNPLDDVASLRNQIALTAPGTKVTLKLLRDGKEKSIIVKIGEMPGKFNRSAKTGGTKLDDMGLALQDLSDELATQFGYKKGQGVLISDVEEDSPAGNAGLQAGQLIEEVNRIRVHNLKELKSAMKKSSHPNRVLLRIRAGEYSSYVVLTVK